MRTLDKASNDALSIDDWAELDKLRGKKWAAEVLLRRRLLAEKLIESQEVALAAKVVAAQNGENLRAFDEMLTPRMKNRRRLLLKRFRAVIRTSDGEIRIFNKKRVLDLEGIDNAELVKVMESTPATRKGIRIKKEPDKEVIKQLSPHLLRKLEPLVWVGQMLYVSIKSTGEKAATNVVRQRRKK